MSSILDEEDIVGAGRFVLGSVGVSGNSSRLSTDGHVKGTKLAKTYSISQSGAAKIVRNCLKTARNAFQIMNRMLDEVKERRPVF